MPSTWTCVHNFFTNLKPYLQPADKNVVFFSHFMHYHLDMRLLQGNHNMFCDIHIFSATTTTTPEALHFSIQELIIVECLAQVQVKFCIVFFCKENFVWLFHVKKKFCVFFCCTMCVIIFFVVQFFKHLNESAVRFSQIETKLSYLVIGKNSWTHVHFRTESKSRNPV